MPAPRECQICWFVYPTLNFRVCNLCKNKYHQSCYFEQRPKQQDHCEACAHVMLQKQGKKPKMQPACIICKNNDGLMKQISENQFAHIFCVLTSRSYQIQSYQKFQVTLKSEKNLSKCKQCKKQSAHLIQCQFCEYKAHKQCLDADEQYVGMNLEGNLQNLNFLLDIVDVQTNESKTLKLIKTLRPNWKGQSKNYIKSVVCEAENKRYCWCFCNKASLNDEISNPSILCDGCNRYVHLSCTGMKDPDQIKSYYCPGCISNQKYEKYAKFPDLINEILKLQTSSFTMSDIRTIDSFPFILSSRLIQNIQKQHSKVIDYLAIKIINQVCYKKNEKSQIPQFFQLIRSVTCEKNSRTQEQIWQAYCDLLKQIDPESSAKILNLKSKESQMLQKEKRKNQIIHNVKYILRDIDEMIYRGVIPNLTVISARICRIRQEIRHQNQIKAMLQKHIDKSLLIPLLLFRTSTINEEKVIETLMIHYFEGKKMSLRDLQQLRVTKKRGCPNFQTQVAWSILQSAVVIHENTLKLDQYETNQERKVCRRRKPEYMEKVFYKIMEGKQTNLKILLPLRKAILKYQTLGQMQKKITVCYQWSVLSKKLHFGFQKKKMSMSGIIEARRQIKKCHYPNNKVSQQLQVLYQFCKPIQRLLKRVKGFKAIKQTVNNDLALFFQKPSVGELQYAIRSIKQTQFSYIWTDLQQIQLDFQLQRIQEPRKKISLLLKLINPQHTYSPVFPQDKKIQLSPSQIVQIRRQLQEGNISMVNIEEYYQIMQEASLAEINQKNAKWMVQKEAQIQNEQQLKVDLLEILEKIKEQEEFKSCCLQDMLDCPQIEQFFVDQMKKTDETKFTYFIKHLKRNKKWFQDMKNLQKGLIKSINYEQICCLEVKLKTSIFDHSKLINQIVIPFKDQCSALSEAIRQHVPYCRIILHNISPKQNIYSPQNKHYKQMKQLRVKDYPLRLYQKDCETLRILTTLQQKMSKRPKQQYDAMLSEFEDIYKQISIYLHELKIVWDMIFKISERLIYIFHELRSEFKKEIKLKYLLRHKKLLKLTKDVVEFGEVPEIIRRFKDLEMSVNSQQKYINLQ